MNELLLQILGGGLYLLNKIFFRFSERVTGERRRQLRIWSWSVYLLGLPPWLIIFADNRNWIAFAIEAGGAPAMLLGLVYAIRRTSTPNDAVKLLNLIAQIAIVGGVGYSLYDFGGLTTINQWLELALVIGFLVGTYRLALQKNDGYLWYVLMHVACGMLMHIQEYPLLFWMQIASLGFIVDAYRLAQTNK